MIIEPGKTYRRSYCPRCMKDSQDLLIFDEAMLVYTCPVCSFKSYGGIKGYCEKCGNSTYGVIGRPLQESEKIPNLCEDCQREIKDFYEEMKHGGVLFACKCGRQGIIHAKSEFAKDFRRKVEMPAPMECGVFLDECPGCKKGRIKLWLNSSQD
jgi:hypothetical protein